VVVLRRFALVGFVIAIAVAPARAEQRRDACDFGEVPYCVAAAVLMVVPSVSTVFNGESLHGGAVWELPLTTYDVRHVIAPSIALYDDMAVPLVRAVYRFRPWPKEQLSGLPQRAGPDLAAGIGAWWHPDGGGPRVELRGFLSVFHATAAYELDVTETAHAFELRLGLEFPLPLL
jgi:hypothetical protein